MQDPDPKINFENNEKKSTFYCSICTETKGTNIKRIKCSKCARFICMGCFESIKVTGMNKCPYCSTSFDQVKSNSMMTSITDIIQIDAEKMEKGLINEAKYYFQKAIDLDSKSITAWKRLGLMYFAQKNWEKSKFCFTKVLKLNPQEKEAKEKYIEADHRIRSYY